MLSSQSLKTVGSFCADQLELVLTILGRLKTCFVICLADDRELNSKDVCELSRECSVLFGKPAEYVKHYKIKTMKVSAFLVAPRFSKQHHFFLEDPQHLQVHFLSLKTKMNRQHIVQGRYSISMPLECCRGK